MPRKWESFIGQTVEIIYIDRQNRITQRIITIRSVTDGTLRAYCHLQRAPRLFRIEHILAVQTAGVRTG